MIEVIVLEGLLNLHIPINPIHPPPFEKNPNEPS